MDPRRRFGWFGVVASVLALVWIVFFAPGFHWTGGVVKSVKIRVTEGESRKPAQGLTVILLPHRRNFTCLSEMDRRSILPDLPREMVGRTSKDGTATLRGQFPAGGTSSLLMRRGEFSTGGDVWIFKGDDFIESRNLEDLIPKARRSLRDELPLVEIALP